MYISRLRDSWGKINTQASPGPTGLQALGGKNGSLPAQKFAVRTMPYIRRLWNRSSKMAKKYLTSFKPGDVLMVVLRCVSCGGESSFPVSGSSLGPVTTKCHACGKERDPASKSIDPRTRVSRLLSTLRDVRDVSANAAADNINPDNTTWTIRLVIESGQSSTGEDVQEDS